MRYKQKNEKGITLIALIITIVILVILALVSIRVAFGEGILQVATDGVGNYAKEQKNEENVFNDADHYIKVATNKKPNIEILKYSDRTVSGMEITAMATDGDGENLTYKLFVGTTRENLVEQTEVKENVEQGTEVSWQVSVADSTSVYYYKIIVADRYAEIDSGIRETNNAPVLGTVEIEKDLDENTGNWVKVKTSGTDAENDKLIYTFKMWKKEEVTNEEELMQQEPTKTAKKENINAGEEVEITINELEEYQEYLCRIDVSDKDNNTIGEKLIVRTYCPGNNQICTDYICTICNGTGIDTHYNYSTGTNKITFSWGGRKSGQLNSNYKVCNTCSTIVIRSTEVWSSGSYIGAFAGWPSYVREVYWMVFDL